MLYVEDTEVTCYASIYNIILVPGFLKYQLLSVNVVFKKVGYAHCI